MRWVKDVGSLYDFIGYVVLSAPNRFPKEDYLADEEQMDLESAFEELRHGITLLDPEVATEEKKPLLVTILNESLAAYREGDDYTGAHRLQDFQDLIFKT